MRSLKLSFLTAAVFLTASLLGREMSPWQLGASISPEPPLSPSKGEGAINTTCFPRFTDIPESLRKEGGQDSKRVIVIYKHEQKLGLYEDGQLTLCVSAEFGDWPYEAKVQSDGESTPEGWYTVAMKRTRNPDDEFPKSVFTEALHISYPNTDDVNRALAKAIITPETAETLKGEINRGELPDQDTAMGGAILIHDWKLGMTTAGCVGLPEEDMHTLFSKTENGDPILILPWQTVLRTDGSLDIATIPDRPPADTIPPGMINWTQSRPGHMVLKAIEITAD